VRFLVVDDETAICEGTARRLQRFLPGDSSVECAYSGEEALEKIAAAPPDILITDIRMSEIDGLTLIERAREHCPDLACIIITAFDSFQYAHQAIRLEVKDFLVKPYDEEDLRRAVDHVVAGLEKKRFQYRDMLGEKLYRMLREGGRFDGDLFKDGALLRPPERVRVVVWNGGDVPPPWTGGWHFRDESRCYQLVPDGRVKLLDWLRRSEMRFGISTPDCDLGKMWREAQRALEIAHYENMPRWVFFQSMMDNRQLTSQNHISLWAINYIAENVGSPISMEDVCLQLHLNYSYFSRQFKMQTGVSFSEYLLEIQMQWALEKMKRGMRVNEAADKLGYGSAESFGKAFARIYGAMPRNYLSRMRKEK